jgi:putative nucleotidyltransferase with HDIG domain
MRPCEGFPNDEKQKDTPEFLYQVMGFSVDERSQGILMPLPTPQAAMPEPSQAPSSAASELPLPSAPSSEFLRFFGTNDIANPVLGELVSVAQRRAPRADPSKNLGKMAPACAPACAPVGKALPPRNPLGPPISPETIVSRVGTLASLPNIYFHVDKAINHPASSTAAIGTILSYDQALCARLLRIANSAFYGFSRRVEGIEDAVRIIGTRQLHDLVLATVVLSHFKGIDSQLVSMKSFWKHSLACSIAARSIARLRREPNAERFFVAGLLHDIGSLAMYQMLPERSQLALERHRDGDKPLEETERAIFGCDHAAVGAALMTSWTLPPFFRDATANHHSAGPRGHTPATAVIHLADLLVQSLDLGSNGELRLSRICPDAWEQVGLKPGGLEIVADEVLALLGEVQTLFLGDVKSA